MQPTETYTVPRRVLDVEDYIDIFRRHKGWIFGPFLVCLVASVVGVYLYPDTYVSDGIIKIEQQQISPNLVQVSVTQDMIDQINSMAETIESRNVLNTVIQNYDLYPKERAKGTMEDVIDQMKTAIVINPLGAGEGRNVPAFRVSFSYPDRHKAQKVVEDLMSRFTSEHTKNLNNQAFLATETFKDEQEQAKKELDDVETQLAEYMSRNPGGMPDQQPQNFSRLQSLDNSEANLYAQVSHLSSEKMLLENRLNIMHDQATQVAKYKPEIEAQQQSQQKSQKLLEAERLVDGLELTLKSAQTKYQDSYPAIKSLKDQIEVAKQSRDKIAAEDAENNKKAVIPSKSGTVSPQEFQTNLNNESTEKQLQAQIALDDQGIEEAQKQIKVIDENIRSLNGRMSMAPQNQKEYEDLRRERGIKMEKYEDMTKKLAQAQMQQDVENKKEGQTLEILDAASDPTSPTTNHPLVIGIGAGVGLLLGIMIAGAREMKDTSLKNLKDVRAYTQLPILGSVPLLENDFVVRRRKRIAWLGWTTACLTAVVLMSGSIIYYITTKNQVP